MDSTHKVFISDPSLFFPSKFSEVSSSANSGILFGRYKEKDVALVADYSVIEIKNIDSKYNIFWSTRKVFYQILEKNFSSYAVFLSSYNRVFINPKSSAYILQNLSFRLKIFLVAILSGFVFIISGLAGILINIFCFIQTIYKLYVFKASVFVQSNNKPFQENNIISHENLPIYTILVPLYREAGKINNIIDVIKKINYPKDKLDVKLILEDDDTQTITATQMLDLEDYFHIIKVPNSGPKTKPKACNYAMNFIRGEFLVIYDAEDRPESTQLLKAIEKFRNLDEKYVCLQANLEIDPSPGSLLNSFFKLEYDMWFKFFLKGLTKLSLPITLGGTSNHFKVNFLKKVGFWDAYNVTEDAEIGIRTSSMGYKIDMLDSYTIEEGPISMIAWFKQRIRWTKGFIVTLITSCMEPLGNNSYIDRLSTLVFSIFGTILVPLALLDGYIHGFSAFTKVISFINTFLFLIFFWSVAYFLSKIDKDLSKSKYSSKWSIAIILFPFYFGLHVIASYAAIIEIMISPDRWNKTDHNIV